MASGPVVTTNDGMLQGAILQSVMGGSYFGFQGIPYAQPPVGPLRFQAPERVAPWTGVRGATSEGAPSASVSLGTFNYLSGSSEDCLYLNVYSKQLPDDAAALPVMVWIHGGEFYGGSSNSNVYGADYLTEKGVVLVTFNYRLGALGFLSLENADCPGNNGLRDQVEALRWVQRNIAAFGGDPGNVTIFGSCAGGASVQFHMLSPMSSGLFHRAVTQSGSVLNPWAMARFPVPCAFALGQALGCSTGSKQRLLQFLMEASAQEVEKATQVLLEVEVDSHYPWSAFAPVVEPVSADPFLCEDPEKLLEEGKMHDVPYILGVSTMECLACGLRGVACFTKDEELERILPIHPNLRVNNPIVQPAIEKIKSFYFENGFIHDHNLTDVFSAVYYLLGNHKALRALSNAAERKSNTFFYQFKHFVGALPHRQLLGYPLIEGTFHGDEIPYLFHDRTREADMTREKESMVEMMGNFWTDFARTGDPTPETQLWPAYTSHGQEHLDIADELQTGRALKADQMNFWFTVLSEIKAAAPAEL